MILQRGPTNKPTPSLPSMKETDALGEWCVSFTRYCKYQSLSCAPLCAQFWGCPACYWYLLKVLNWQQKAHHLNPPLAEKIDKKWGNSHSGRVDLMKKLLIEYTSWRCFSKAPCNNFLSLSQWSTMRPELIDSSSWHHRRSIAVYGNQTANGLFRLIMSTGLCRRLKGC